MRCSKPSKRKRLSKSRAEGAGAVVKVVVVNERGWWWRWCEGGRPDVAMGGNGDDRCTESLCV